MAEPALENFHCLALWISLMLICSTLLFLYAFLAKTFLKLLYGPNKKAFQLLLVCSLNCNKHQKENYFYLNFFFFDQNFY